MSTLRADTIANAAGTVSVPTNTVVNGSAKAWVNFNGTGTVAIRASFNVSSITDNGTGDYTVNFTNALPDANYSATFGCVQGVVASYGTQANVRSAADLLTTSLRMTSWQEGSGAALADNAVLSVVIHD